MTDELVTMSLQTANEIKAQLANDSVEGPMACASISAAGGEQGHILHYKRGDRKSVEIATAASGVYLIKHVNGRAYKPYRVATTTPSVIARMIVDAAR